MCSFRIKRYYSTEILKQQKQLAFTIEIFGGSKMLTHF